MPFDDDKIQESYLSWCDICNEDWLFFFFYECDPIYQGWIVKTQTWDLTSLAYARIPLSNKFVAYAANTSKKFKAVPFDDDKIQESYLSWCDICNEDWLFCFFLLMWFNLLGLNCQNSNLRPNLSCLCKRRVPLSNKFVAYAAKTSCVIVFLENASPYSYLELCIKG